MQRIDYHNALIAMGFENTFSFADHKGYLGDNVQTIYSRKSKPLMISLLEPYNQKPQAFLSSIIISVRDLEDNEPDHYVRMDVSGVVTEQDLKKAIFKASMEFTKKIENKVAHLKVLEAELISLRKNIMGD
jgi:hypothetical protein